MAEKKPTGFFVRVGRAEVNIPIFNMYVHVCTCRMVYYWLQNFLVGKVLYSSPFAH